MEEHEFLISHDTQRTKKVNYFLIFLVVILTIVVIGLVIFILLPKKGLPDYQKYHHQFLENVNRERIGEFMKAYSAFPHLAGKKFCAIKSNWVHHFCMNQKN
jgi:hypothetical protein